MKKTIIALLPAMLLFMMANAQINTPAPSPSCEIKQTVGLTDVTINYSRPGMKDRTIFAVDGLVPFGQIWRTGANQATTIEFSEDVVFMGADVEAGKYALYTIPGADSWSVMLYSDLSLGGNVGGYDEEKEVMRATTTPVQLPLTIETLTLDVGTVTDATAIIGMLWESTYVPIPIAVHTDKQVTAQIESFAANPMAQVAGNYLNGGWYYHGKDEKKALEYLTEGLKHSSSPFNFFWMERKSQVQAALGDYAGAIKTAKEAHEAGANAPENARGFYNGTVKGQLDANIKQWMAKS